MSELHVVQVEQEDVRLGRQVVHDPRSRAFALAQSEPLKRDWTHRIYQPRPLPNQPIGCCTGVDQAVRANAKGNRVMRQVLDMDDAIRIYSRATQLDPWAGSYPPSDTGSSGLAAAKAAREQGIIDRYEWIFNGAAGVLAALEKHTVGIGAWWLASMFNPDPETGLVDVTGPRLGGHQWSVIGYRKRFHAFVGQCWWSSSFGVNGRFLIRYSDLDALLMDNGDAHVTYRKQP